MHEAEGVGIVLVAVLAAGYLLAGAKGLKMSRMARYIISAILIAIGVVQLMALI